ncbi:APC family permease [Fluoribacter gormanii]|uniref:Amino acid/polyamine/organocation transporter, APC superfamily n=1 Tax=Fluoribacter gormanii TaxID=464 RepID=A0A377GGN5_9GAMM|nr:APC family permease [Fluoribacter gormanii]KTD02921.1 amino acid permease [Fluoribacter gormanii]MCW8444735.1 APC family permease [Fluoribacter gormanii]SIR85334.1 amino acid/polyamine/organocation transporter, APC superfamily [Fluoribacter gormanii]STO23705.1 L-aspartate transporter [Fluoribacter gormanii]
MKKNLSPLSLLWISITSMVGSGWLFGSLYSAHFAGPAAIIAWPLAGFLLLFVALSYAELGTMFPQSNSLACLPLYTHGRLTSSMMSSMTWFSLAILPVIETQGVIQYASNYLPDLVTHHGVYYRNTHLGYVLSLVVLMSFVLFNYFGIGLFARVNAAFTVWKIIIPVLTIASLVTMSYHPDNFFQYGGFMPYGWQGIMAAMSSGGVLFSLLGFRQVIIMMGELEKPGQYIPLILCGSLFFTTLLYTGLQWSFIGSVSEHSLEKGWVNLSFIGDAGPFAALVALVGMLWLSVLLYADAFISPYSTGLVYSTTASHMLSSMGSVVCTPKILAKRNKYQVPWVSLGVNFLLAATMSLVLHGWQEMSAFLVAILMVSYSIGPIALVCLRKQLPNYKRPFRLQGSNLIAFIGFYVCTIGVYWSGFHSVRKLLVITILGLGGTILYCFIKNTHQELDSKHAVWFILYLLGLGMFSYLGNYGGKHILPQYWDLVYLLLFSLFVFGFAILSRKPSANTQKLVIDNSYQPEKNKD